MKVDFFAALPLIFIALGLIFGIIGLLMKYFFRACITLFKFIFNIKDNRYYTYPSGSCSSSSARDTSSERSKEVGAFYDSNGNLIEIRTDGNRTWNQHAGSSQKFNVR